MISEQTIQTVRQRTDLVALIGETIKLVRRGRSWIGLCPFHQEKSPSFHVSPERGYFHCFGCHESGNAITFVMKTEGLSFPEAVRRLAEREGIEIEETATEQERREEAAARRQKDDLYQVCHVAALYFERMLNEHPTAHLAHQELEKRGLVPNQANDQIALALQAFRIGYAPSGWDGLSVFLVQQGFSPVAAERAGLVIPRSNGGGYYDRFRNRLMFAVIDPQGRTVGFSGRILPDPQTGLVDKDTGKYVNSPETPIYRKGETVFGLYQARRALRQLEEAIVVEGNFDVVSLHARGIENVVAPLGTAFTFEQAQQIKRFAPTATLLFDADSAGKKATRAAKEPCKKAGLITKVASLPSGKDPDELIKDKGPDAVRACVRAARGMLEYLIETVLDEGYARGDTAERSARFREVTQLLSEEDDPTVRAMARRYADEVARRLLLVNNRLIDSRTGTFDENTFRALSRSVTQALAPKTTVTPQRKTKLDPRVETILGCLFDFPVLLDSPEVAKALDYLDGDSVFVVQALRDSMTPGADETTFELNPDNLLAQIPATFHAFARHRLAAPVHLDPAIAQSELLATAEKLKREHHSREMGAIEREAARAEAMGAEDEAMALLLEAQRKAQLRRRL